MRANRSTPKTLTEAEVKTLLAVTSRSDRDFRDHILLLLALSTGLRVSELVALNVGDLRNGKGVRTVVALRAETTKGKRGGDIVMPERVRRKVATFLTTWKAERNEALDDESPLFASRGGGRSATTKGSRLSVRAAEHIFSVWQSRASFDRRLHFHSLRHTFATRLLRASGGNLRLVQQACRHASVTTTTVYTHVIADDLSAAVEKLGW